MKNLLIFLLISTTSFAQNKKEQIEILNFRVDSLNTVLATTRDNSAKDISILNDKIKKVRDELTNLQTSNNKLTKENDILKLDLGELSKENDKLKLGNSSWSFDTIHAKVTHSCYYYVSSFPYFISSTQNDSIRKKINSLIRETSFKIPSIMQNGDYKNFRKCEEGDYNHLIAEHGQHVLQSDCDWCQSEFYSSVENIEQSNYLSILMRVDYEAGGNWRHSGYNSLNFKNNKIITIPNSLSVKNKLIEEIKDYLLNNPLIDIDGNKYPIINEIQQWNIDDLTFYFKNDSLRLVFVNDAHGVWNQTFDVQLPKLQQYLKL
ncbi:hypothetical protein N8328_04390 [Crocinitomicaceae bacterium]|nr:hypothetical protein [Crocinitomicaceae bacterium]